MDSKGTVQESLRKNNELSKNGTNRKSRLSIKEYAKQYCENSTIGGLPYIVKNVSSFERVWWILIFIFGIIGSVYMVYQIMDQWITTPVLVSLATKEMHIHDIPFPAVTICPESKISTRCLNYTHILKARRKEKIFMTDPEENEYFDYMALLCKPENHEGTFAVLEKSLSSLLDTFDNMTGYMDDAEEGATVEEISLNDYSKFLSNCSVVTLENAMCYWMEQEVECKKVMTPILTDEGLCYSFNMYDVRDIYSSANKMEYYPEGNRQRNWNPEKGYKKRYMNISNFYPRRALLSGAKNAFEAVFLTPKHEINYACRDFSIQGVRVSLHTPTKIPRPSQVFFSVGLNRITTAAIIPKKADTTKKIKAYSPEKRNCFFGREKRLKFFKFYSQSNCNLECWTNYTLKHCGCVNFYMPKDENTKICNLEKRFCISDARRSYSQDILKERLKFRLSYDLSDEENTACNCLPLCSDLTYNVELASGVWDFDNEDDADYDDVREYMSGFYASAVKVYFKNSYFLPTQRDELFGTTDFISNIGGALGLITGFSLVSLGEIVYFFSIKIIANYRKYGYWSEPRIM